MNTEGESVYGSTNLYTSLNDIIIWMQYLLNLHKTDKALVEELFTPSYLLNDGSVLNYTYGFNISNHHGRRVADHGGYAMGFRSQIRIFPDDNLAVISMTNNESINSYSLTSQIADMCFTGSFISEKKKEWTEIKIPVDKLQNYTGCYRMPDGMKLNFELNHDTFQLVYPDEKKYIMYPQSENEFFIKEMNTSSVSSWEVSATAPKLYGISLTKTQRAKEYQNRNSFHRAN
ncbi:MAG: serine hydrolase [Bacteroidales bacterium]|nr:serine hydrolase [Bacteroidales bacterium]